MECVSYSPMPSLKLTANGLTLVVVDARPKRSVLPTIREHIASSVCLSENCGRAVHARGLCARCWQRFRAALLTLAPDDRWQEEARQIREGKILRIREKQKQRNPFRRRL